MGRNGQEWARENTISSNAICVQRCMGLAYLNSGYIVGYCMS
jgi:hypothetical protein